jgi:hypothetical protein
MTSRTVNFSPRHIVISRDAPLEGEREEERIMKRMMFRSLLLVSVVGLLICWTIPAFAGPDTQFAVYTGNSLWGEYTSPYTTGSNNVGPVICDDIADTVTVGKVHGYYSMSANTIIANAAGGIWPAGIKPSQVYAAAASLVLDIYNATNGRTQSEYSWALWALFDPTAVQGKLSSQIDAQGCQDIYGSSAWSGTTCNFTPYSDGFIDTALTHGLTEYGLGDFNNLLVYVPQNLSLTGPCTTPGSCDSQEFWGVPEGGAALMYLLLASVICFGAMSYSRRQPTMGGLA